MSIYHKSYVTSIPEHDAASAMRCRVVCQKFSLAATKTPPPAPFFNQKLVTMHK